MSGKRWLLVLAMVGALLLGGAGIGLLLVLPRYVENKVLSTAAAQGVTLKPERIAFGWGWVQLTQVKVQLERVPGIDMQVGRIDVALDGLAPQSIQLSNVEGLVSGSLSQVSLELSEWTAAHPSAYALPLSAKNVHVRFVEPAQTPPWLEVSSGELTRTRTGGVFAAQRTRFLGVELGKAGAGFSREGSAVALGFGEADLARAPFRVEVFPKTASATFTLAPTAAEKLAKPLGWVVPIAGVVVSSKTDLKFPSGAASGPVSGVTNITLKGYVPPHPFELDGFIFGDTTSFDTRFVLSPERDRLTLSECHLQAGRFELRGDGLVIRAADHSQLTMKLSGELPCSALAAVEAESRLSKILNHTWAAKGAQFAEKLINGSVAIGLEIEADTRDLSRARVERRIGVGCGLHPMSLADLAKLVPLPAELAELLKTLPALPSDLSQLPGLPALPSALPPLPSGMPALPTALPPFPNFGLPSPRPTAPPSKPRAPASTAKASLKPAASAGP